MCGATLLYTAGPVHGWILRFAGNGKGHTKLTLTYRRPWETTIKSMANGTSASAPIFTANVDVGGVYSDEERPALTRP